MARGFLLAFLLLVSSVAWAQTSVSGVRTWAAAGQTRVVFDLSRATEHRVFTLTGPDRVVIDFEAASMDLDRLGSLQTQGLVTQLRGARRDGGNLRIVLDLEEAVEVRSFLAQPNDIYGHRLVVDLVGTEPQRPQPVRTASQSGRRDIIVAVDAGHGGEDPGAIGPSGVFEKDVVLAVAERLAALINREPGMRAVLIRDGDYYVGLGERTRRARQHQADLFVSLHADAIASRNVRGASVYTLSRNGASTEAARMLAQRENAADLIGGVSLNDKDDLVASVILDLSRAATVESSSLLASTLLGRLGEVATIHKRGAERAGFRVLRSLDIPSVLVELAFISNPEEEQLLSQRAHQDRLAGALLAGIRDYTESALLPELRMARGEGADTREHLVQRGETLSAIARRYEVNLTALRAANDLSGDHILVGTRLIIP